MEQEEWGTPNFRYFALTSPTISFSHLFRYLRRGKTRRGFQDRFKMALEVGFCGKLDAFLFPIVWCARVSGGYVSFISSTRPYPLRTISGPDLETSSPIFSSISLSLSAKYSCCVFLRSSIWPHWAFVLTQEAAHRIPRPAPFLP